MLTLPAMLGGIAASPGLAHVALVGIGGFVLLAAAGAVVLHADWPLRGLGRAVQGVHNHVFARRRQPLAGLDKRFLDDRDSVREVLGDQWRRALLLTTGRIGCDFGCLLCALRATGAHPQPSLALLAYAAANIVALIPLTPGGLGVVEASLGSLLILAGVQGRVWIVSDGLARDRTVVCALDQIRSAQSRLDRAGRGRAGAGG